MTSIAVVAVFAASGDALADEVTAEACEEAPFTCLVAPVSFDAQEALPIEFDVSTGWVPPGSPLQVKIAALLAANTRLALKGALVAEWPHDEESAALRLTAPGDPMGGVLGYHYGLATTAEAKLGVSVGPLNFNWQGPIPYIPQVDLQVQDELTFDAWGWEPGAESTSSSMPQKVAQVDLSGVIGPSIPGLTGGFQLDVAVDLTVRWTNHRIALAAGETADTVAGGDITAPDGPDSESFTTALEGSYAEVSIHPEGTVDYGGTIHLIPGIYVSILGNTWSIPIVDIPIPFDANSLDLSFEPKLVHMPLPDVRLDVETIDFGVITLGDESFRSYAINNDGELTAATAITTTDLATFPLWETELEVDPEDSVWATLRFTPTAVGKHEAQLMVASNDPDEPLQIIQLVGEVEAAPLDWGPADAVEAPDAAAVIANSGCGCRVHSRSGQGRGWLLGGLALALLARRRRLFGLV